MNGYVARFGKNSIGFGLLWTMLPGVNRSSKEIKDLAADHGATAYVQLPIAGRTPLIGLLPDEAQLDRGTSRAATSSAAALLSLVFGTRLQNAAFGFALPNKKIAFLGFRDGVPLIGFDRVISVEALEDLTSEYLGVLGDQASTAAFYTNGVNFRGCDAAPFDITWFGTVGKKSLGAARVRRAKPSTFLWVSVAALVVISAIGLNFYDEHQKESMAKASRMVQQDPNELYARSIRSYLAEAGHPAPAVASSMIDVVNELPMFHHGWRLDRASCVLGSCVLTWSNTDGGTYEGFAGVTLPGINAFKTAYKEGMATIETSFDYTLRGKRGMQEKALPTQEKFVLYFGSKAQQLKFAGVTVTVQKAALVGAPAVPASGPAINEEVLEHPVLEGSWNMVGDWIFYEVLTSLPANMTIEALDLGISGESISMNVSGKYYVRN